jgi:excisionase family DNA binding protein
MASARIPEASPRAHVPPYGGRPEGSPMHQLLTIEQLACALAVSPKTVRRLMARGFPHIRFGRVLRFDPVDVQRWLEARRS